ncbi:MAG: HAMP domain-containing protein, partial [Gammaproteobacteria bacterium]
MNNTSLTVKLALVFIPIVAIFVLVDMYLSQMSAIGTTVAKFVAAFVIINIWLKVSVADPLKQLTGFMGEVATGNYDNDIDENRQDEIGKLLQGVSTMQQQLSHNSNASSTESAASARISSALKVCQANVMMADADLNIIYIHDSVVKMLSEREAAIQTVLPNFKVSELVGTCVDDFHANPAHQRGMLDKLTDVYKTDLELAGLTFGLIATPVFGDNGERLGTVVEWEDKTERLAAEKEAKAQADKNAGIANALQVCQANVMMADADLNIVYINESVVEMLSEREAAIQTVLPNFKVSELIGTCVD